MSARPQRLVWNCEWLGFPVGLSAGDQRGTNRHSISSEPRTGNPAPISVAAAQARAAGARLTDNKLTYQLGVTAPELASVSATVKIDPAAEIMPTLWELARQNIDYSRFGLYKRVSKNAFIGMYDSWLHRVMAKGIGWVASSAKESVALHGLWQAGNPH